MFETKSFNNDKHFKYANPSLLFVTRYLNLCMLGLGEVDVILVFYDIDLDFLPVQ